jgi:hypothetical protein
MFLELALLPGSGIGISPFYRTQQNRHFHLKMEAETVYVVVSSLEY